MLPELTLTKIWNLKPMAGTVDTEERPWLPVTKLDVNGKRITVRAPYPMGDYDDAVANPRQCETCYGSGKDGLGNDCPDCDGTGYDGGYGVITVSENGIVTLRYDMATLGITDDGKLFAKLKVDENGGLVNDENGIRVKVDNDTLYVDNEGILRVRRVKSYFYAGTAVGQEYPANQKTEIGIKFDGVQFPDTVQKVRIHLDLDMSLRNSGFLSADDMTLFKISTVSPNNTRVNESFVQKWDKTAPHTAVAYNAVMDVSALVNGNHEAKFVLSIDQTEDPDGVFSILNTEYTPLVNASVIIEQV